MAYRKRGRRSDLEALRLPSQIGGRYSSYGWTDEVCAYLDVQKDTQVIQEHAIEEHIGWASRFWMILQLCLSDWFIDRYTD
jgi:hypothetical protein